MFQVTPVCLIGLNPSLLCTVSFFSYKMRVIINFLPHRTFADQWGQHLQKVSCVCCAMVKKNSQCPNTSFQLRGSCPAKEQCSLGIKSSLASKGNKEKTPSSQSQANSRATHFGRDFALYSPLLCGGFSPVRGGMTWFLYIHGTNLISS